MGAEGIAIGAKGIAMGSEGVALRTISRRLLQWSRRDQNMKRNESLRRVKWIAMGAEVIAMIAKEIALIADKRLQLKVKNWYNSENLTSHPVCSTAIRLSSLLSSQQLSNYYTRRWEKGGHEVHTMRQGHSLVPN